MAAPPPAVSVIVPAYNAAATILETLRSVSAQTFERIEIIVVEDGSTDDTAEIVERYARTEPRLRLIRQANAGVAAARNVAIEQAAARYIAPIDADDLWHPTRLEKHLAALEQNSNAGFVYSPFRTLDAYGRVIGSHPLFGFEGHVFHRQLFFNMIGNGSGIMFRKDAALRVGGYDNALREARLDGSEDWLLQMRLSLICEAALVPEYLVGYRKAPGAMSADPRRIWRSQIFAVDRLKPHAPPEAQPRLEAAKLHFQVRAALESLRGADIPSLTKALAAGARQGLIGELSDEVTQAVRRSVRAKMRRGRPSGQHFLQVDPQTPGDADLDRHTRKLIERLTIADQAQVSRCLEL